jgi:mannitol-1-phosphate 5-dehydrogenase
MADFLIFGAGKIARGFIAHLLFLSGYTFAFVEADEALVYKLNSRGSYHVHVYGAPEKDAVISGYRAVSVNDSETIRAEISGAKAVFTSVGGKNLLAIAPMLADALQSIHPNIINVITCENWKQPSEILKKEVARCAPDVTAGFAESVIMRSAIEPTAEILANDPLAVCVSDYWHLPVDAGKLSVPLPEIKSVEPIENFSGFLQRKFYTYNAANGTASYLGALLGHTFIADAARDVRIIEVLRQVYRETGEALSKWHGIPMEDQMAFAGTSFDKLRDRAIIDTTERNARDPMRKLGCDDRLVGPAKMVLSYGITPDGLATAIAAAAYYQNEADPSAVELLNIRERDGLAGVLREVCKLEPDEPLYKLILEKEQEMRKKKWIL